MRRSLRLTVCTTLCLLLTLAAHADERDGMADATQRETLKLKARQRARQDAKKYSKAQLQEAEELYQVANKNWRSPEAKASLEAMLARFPDINRTGCAVLYLAQMSESGEREALLKRAAGQHGDCYYLNGVQVGAYARLLLAHHYLASDRPADAVTWAEQVLRDYPGSIDHGGRLLEPQAKAVLAVAAEAAGAPTSRPTSQPK